MAGSSPVAAWSAAHASIPCGGSQVVNVPVAPPLDPGAAVDVTLGARAVTEVLPGPQQMEGAGASVAAMVSKAAMAGKGSAGVDGVCFSDAAKCEVFMCFEGPLGDHLNLEMKERIWKGEYIEIFCLLPLEKLNLDKVKPDKSKKEEKKNSSIS